MSVTFTNCAISDRDTIILPKISWKSDSDNWLIIGPNGSGKTVLVSAIAGLLTIDPSTDGYYQNSAPDSTALVSFETAAALLEEERRLDDSDFIEGGIDIGRTPRRLLIASLPTKISETFPQGKNLETHPSVILCGITSILDRGLKYLSTGEIRRTLLCKALVSEPAHLILDEPFDGLDLATKAKLTSFLSINLNNTQLFLVQDRLENLPTSLTKALLLSERKIAWQGNIAEYPGFLQRIAHPQITKSEEQAIQNEYQEITMTHSHLSKKLESFEGEILVQMNDVHVQWSQHVVLDKITWTLRKGEHWLIRGPNGSGKTTFLELITGDNPQVYMNDIWLFGRKRGTGETIWEIKERLGIVSYRLHTEYRMLDDLNLEEVVLSGLRDSIGLYSECSDEERSLARKWLAIAGFSQREKERFKPLSYGEQRALLIIRAAIKEPDILILDEPCHGLDEIHKTTILSLLEIIANQGKSTLLHVTHDPNEVLPCVRHILEFIPNQTPMYQIKE